MSRKVIQNILKVIQNSDSFFLTSHINPDGDSIASETAMALLLERLGKKKYVIANRDAAPDNYLFLPRAGKIRQASKVKGNFDVALILDASDPQRIGSIIDLDKQVKTVIIIDHHLSGIPFGKYNYLDKDSASCTEQIYQLIKAKFGHLTKEEATCIYTGIMTETNKFQEANTNPSALRTTALLLETGINPTEICRKIYEDNSPGQIRLLGLALSGLELSSQDRVATVVVTSVMLKKAGAGLRHCDGIINFARSIKSVKIAILVRQQDNGYKISLRSKGDINVNAVALKFGGGGHRRAAGFFLAGSLAQVKKAVLKQVEKQLTR